MTFDVIVIGAGPAGLAAAAYALQYHLNIAVIAPDVSGKAGAQIHLPWIDTNRAVSSELLAIHWQHRLLTGQHATIVNDVVVEVKAHADGYRVRTTGNLVYETRSVVIATGVTPQRLGIPDEHRLVGYGVSYSAITHAPFFKGRCAVVVGNTPRALEAVASLRRLAADVIFVTSERTMLEDTPLGQRLLGDEAVRVYSPATIIGIDGDRYVSGVTIEDDTGCEERLPSDGVFVELGLTAHTAFLGISSSELQTARSS